MKTSLRGNFSNKDAGLLKFVAKTSTGLPAIHAEKINRLVRSGVKTDQHPTGLVTDVFNRMPIALWDVSDIAGVQLLGSKSAMRAEHRHAEVAFDYVLPFVGIWVPVQFAQGARL